MIDYNYLDEQLALNKKVVLMFSGGKDSIALWHLLKDYLPKITVLHINTGKLLPEVDNVIAKIKADTPNFVQLDTNVDKWHLENGLPTDLMPTSSTPMGIAFGMSNLRLVDRWTCCGANLWAPAANYITENKVDIVIRGTKSCDSKRLPHNGGASSEGYKLWLPIKDWSHDDVFSYLKDVGAVLPNLYKYNVNAPECSTCTAWLSEEKGAYLKRFYPKLYDEYKWKLGLVTNEVIPHIQQLHKEMAS